MNSAKSLYNILNIIIYLILLSILAGIVLVLLTVFNILPSDSILVRPSLMDYKSDIGLYIFISMMLMAYSVFVYGLWKLKEACKFLIDHNFYHIQLIKGVVTFGKCMVLVGVFSWLIDGLSGIHFDNEISISLSEKTFVYLFIIAMGLFAMLIGNVLRDAKVLKNENDLTI